MKLTQHYLANCKGGILLGAAVIIVAIHGLLGALVVIQINCEQESPLPPTPQNPAGLPGSPWYSAQQLAGNYANCLSAASDGKQLKYGYVTLAGTVKGGRAVLTNIKFVPPSQLTNVSYIVDSSSGAAESHHRVTKTRDGKTLVVIDNCAVQYVLVEQSLDSGSSWTSLVIYGIGPGQEFYYSIPAVREVAIFRATRVADIRELVDL